MYTLVRIENRNWKVTQWCINGVMTYRHQTSCCCWIISFRSQSWIIMKWCRTVMMSQQSLLQFLCCGHGKGFTAWEIWAVRHIASWVCHLPIYTAGRISIEHVTIFLSNYISKGAVDMKFLPDVFNNPSNPYIQIRSEIKLYVIKWNDIGKKYWTHEEREVQKGMESQDTSWNLSVIRKQSCP